MQFRLRTLFIITAVVCVYCGILNAPPFVALPLFCVVAWVTPAYWIAGVIYAREARRAFYIGGLCGGAVPFLALVFWSLAMVPSFLDGRGYRNFGNFGRSGYFGEYQLFNLFSSLAIFAPVVLAFMGGWVSLAVYYSLQPKKVQPPISPFGPTISFPSPQPKMEGERRPSE